MLKRLLCTHRGDLGRANARRLYGQFSSNNDVSINNMELFTLLLEQKNNNNKNNKQTIITKSTKNISLKTKNYIKTLTFKLIIL